MAHSIDSDLSMRFVLNATGSDRVDNGAQNSVETSHQPSGTLVTAQRRHNYPVQAIVLTQEQAERIALLFAPKTSNTPNLLDFRSHVENLDAKQTSTLSEFESRMIEERNFWPSTTHQYNLNVQEGKYSLKINGLYCNHSSDKHWVQFTIHALLAKEKPLFVPEVYEWLFKQDRAMFADNRTSSVNAIRKTVKTHPAIFEMKPVEGRKRMKIISLQQELVKKIEIHSSPDSQPIPRSKNL